MTEQCWINFIFVTGECVDILTTECIPYTCSPVKLSICKYIFIIITVHCWCNFTSMTFQYMNAGVVISILHTYYFVSTACEYLFRIMTEICYGDFTCMPFQSFVNQHIPNAYGFIWTTCEYLFRIMAEYSWCDGICMTIYNLDALAWCYIPNTQRLVITSW